MAVYSQAMSEDNAEQMGRLRHNVMLAIQEDITPRQRECMVLYYQKGLNMPADCRADGGGQVHGIPQHQAGRVPAAPLPALRGGTAAEAGCVIFLQDEMLKFRPVP